MIGQGTVKASLARVRGLWSQYALLWPLARRRLAIPGRLRPFWRDAAAVVGLSLITVVFVAAVGAPLLAPHDPTAVHLEQRLLAPNRHFPLGTDHLGRDELSRLLYGARTTLAVASVVLATVMAIACTLGTLAGYYGGWLDTVVMSLVDLLLAFPALILAVAIVGTLGPSLTHAMLALAAVWWAGYARLIRGMVLAVRQREFIEAARALGASDTRIMLHHIVRNTLGPLVVLATLDMGWIILGISGLNFLGLGTQPPTPEWGVMLSDGRPFMQSAPRMMLYPGVAICLVVLGFNLLGDGLRDVLDPTNQWTYEARQR